MEEGRRAHQKFQIGHGMRRRSEDVLKLHLKQCMMQEEESVSNDDNVIHKYSLREGAEKRRKATTVCIYCHKEIPTSDIKRHLAKCGEKELHNEKELHYKSHRSPFPEGIRMEPDLRHLELANSVISERSCLEHSIKEDGDNYSFVLESVVKLNSDIKEIKEVTNDLMESLDVIKQERQELRKNKYRNIQGFNKLTKLLEGSEDKNLLSESITEMASNFNCLKENNELLRVRVEELTLVNQEIIEDNKALKSQIDKFFKDGEGASAPCEADKSLKESVDKLKVDNLEVKMEIEILKENIDRVKDGIKDQSKSNKELKETLATMKLEVADINESDKKVKLILEEFNEHNKNTIKEQLLLRGLVEDVKTHIAASGINFKKQLEEVTNRVNLVEKDNKSLRDIKDNMIRDHEEMKTYRIKAKEHLDSIEREFKKMNNISDEMIFDIKDVLSKVIRKQRSINLDTKIKVEKIENRINSMISSREDLLNLTIGRQIWTEGKTLENFRVMLSKQLFNSPDAGKDNITIINSGQEIDSTVNEVDMGLKSINGPVYKCRLKHAVNVLNKDERMVKLCIDQITVTQPWPPPRTDRVMWCAVDPADCQVLYYQVRDGKAGAIPNTGLRSRWFGWFVIAKDFIEKLKSKSINKKVHSAFIVYKNPT